MTKLKILSSSIVGTTALYPFTFLTSSASGDSVPVFKVSKIQEKVSVNSPLFAPPDQSHNLVLTTERSQETSLINSKTSENNDYLSVGKDSINDKQQLKEEKQPDKKLSSEDIQKMKRETNLDKWLDSINPLIRQKQSLTIITRWNARYFKIIQWDKDCQCFIEADTEYGIWSNYAGLFTIGKKWEQPQTNLVSKETNPKCTNFNGFWYQDWNTWWRLSTYLKTFDTDRNSHIAVASCYKDPVIFLGTDTYIPLFLKAKGSKNISTYGPMNSFYNHQAGRFEPSRDEKEIPEHFSKMNSYLDWKKLWNLNGSGRNLLWSR